MLNKKSEFDCELTLEDVSGLLNKCLTEIRAVYRNLNNAILTQLGLAQSMRYEFHRLDKLVILKTSFVVKGDD